MAYPPNHNTIKWSYLRSNHGPVVCLCGRRHDLRLFYGYFAGTSAPTMQQATATAHRARQPGDCPGEERTQPDILSGPSWTN